MSQPVLVAATRLVGTRSSSWDSCVQALRRGRLPIHESAFPATKTILPRADRLGSPLGQRNRRDLPKKITKFRGQKIVAVDGPGGVTTMLNGIRRRNVLFLAGASILSLGLAVPALGQDRVELTYWNWAPHIDEIVDIWNEANPDIHVTVSRAAGAAEIVQKLSAAHTAGNPPDVTNVTYGDLPALIVNGLVTDITPEMAPLQEKITPVAWNLVTFDGTTWATPQGTSPMFFF